MNIGNLFKSLHISKQIIREYAFKSDLKIKWVRPEKIPCIRPEKSGDMSKLKPLKPDELMLEYQNSRELQNADDTVKALFMLNNNPRNKASRVHRIELIKEVQRHSLDYGSMEVRLARMTASIRRYQEHMENFPRDKMIKVRLKELIDKRKKFLKYLRRWDYPRFEWILEKLDLVYKPPPAEFHWITRKESLQKLTNIHCEKIKEERLAEYRKSLEAQQVSFLEDAIKKMKFVRQEQIDCDVPVTVSEEDIAATEKLLKELKQLRANEDKTNTNTSGIDTSF